MKRFFSFLGKCIKNAFLGIVVASVFGLFVLILAIFDVGKYWDQLASGFSFFPYLSLILFRVAIYSLPAIVIGLLSKVKKLKIQGNLTRFFEIQFITYAAIKLIWEFLALDYVWSTEIFANLDSSIVIVGLLLSLVLRKRIRLEADL